MIYDVLVVGSGGAGLTAAIELKQKGISVVVLSKTNAIASQTVQAQGGINAVLSHSKIDNIQNHINDTFKSSHDIGDIDAISMVCNNANDTIKWLDDLGVPFSRDKHNNIAQRKMAGSSEARTCYSSDYTGLKIMHTLYDTALKLGIKFINDHLLLNIIKENDKVKGITALNIKNSEVVQILSKKVILATGGYGGVYYNHNTNSSATTSDGIVAAYNVGCHIKNMEFVQFHPTSLKDKYILISESARAEGGYLVLKDGSRFVDELLPRDVVAREIFKQIQKGNEVFLDLRHLGYEKITHLIPQEYKLCLTFKGLKMDKDLIPIIPAVHYSMGGIKIDQKGQTNIKNLYAVGECSATGVHGANRLGGNSLLELIVFGRNIAKYIKIDDIKIEEKTYDIFTKDKNYIQSLFENDTNINFEKLRDKFGSMMYHNVGLYRDEKNLLDTLDTIKNYDMSLFALNDKSKIYNTNLKELIEFKNMIQTAKMIIKSAIHRKESRGSHTRIEFPKENNTLSKSTIIYKEDKNIHIGYENES